MLEPSRFLARVVHAESVKELTLGQKSAQWRNQRTKVRAGGDWPFRSFDLCHSIQRAYGIGEPGSELATMTADPESSKCQIPDTLLNSLCPESDINARA